MQGVGEALREARLARGLTHEYISQIIKIRPEFLKALEDGDMDALPGAFYAKNFLRRYADYLGLDSAAMVEQFVAAEATSATTDDTFIVRPAASSGAAGRHWRPNLGLVVALLLVAAAGLALAYRAFLSPSPAPLAALTPTPVRMATAPRATPTTTQPVVAAAPSPTAEPTEARTASPKPSATATRRPRRPATGGTGGSKTTPTATATSRPTARATATPRPTATRTPNPTPTRTPRPTPTRTPRPTATPTEEPEATGAVVASIRTVVPAAVRIELDGRAVFEDVIEPGDTRAFGADANLYVYSNDAQNVLVSVNECAERPLDDYGCPGCEVAYYNFPRGYYDCR